MKDEQIRNIIISENSNWFVICNSLSKLISIFVNYYSFPMKETRLAFLAGLFSKIVNSYDAAKLLIEYGYAQDSGAIVRSLMESVFVLKACIDDNEYFNNYFRTDIADLEKFSKNQLRYADDMRKKHPSFDELFYNPLQEANRQIEFYESVQKIEYDASFAAKKSGLQNIYYATYSHLSCMNVHPSPRAIMSRIAFDEEEYPSELKIGPETDGADIMLLLTVKLMIIALECMDNKFDAGLSDDIATVFGLFVEQEKIIGK